jgi:nicotinate phosphoribosyltransferase
MEPLQGALLTDLYQLTMVQAYLESGQTDTAVFEFFGRRF